MADAFQSKFNCYADTISGNIDPKNLYIKNIPADLTEETFLRLVTKNGKKINSHRLFPAKDGRDVTIGLVSYDKESDALEIKTHLNNQPPFYLKIDFALSKMKNTNTKHSLEQRVPSVNEKAQGLLPIPGVGGRGRSVVPGSSTQSHLASKGRGHMGLTVLVEGNKRTAFQNLESVDAPRESTYSPDLPDLIPNLCLNCNEKGDLSCKNCHQTYCSVDCQRQDWPNHQSVCKSVSSSISKSNRFANDSSYMSEGSSSDNDKKMDNNLSMNQSINKNQRSSSTPEGKPLQPKVGGTSPNKPHMHLKGTKSNESGIQRKFIKANEILEQKLFLTKPYKVSVCKSCSPSNFWIHLDGAENILYKMEKEMASVVIKNPVKCAIDDVCCTYENGKFMRIRILKLRPSSFNVMYIDYGGTSDLMNSKVYFLPEVFKKYPAQALECSLVDEVNSDNVVWSDEEVSSFAFHTKNKLFTGHVHRFVKNSYNISLVNDEGISLYSILRISPMEEFGSFPQSDSPVTIPSVLSELKQGVEVTIGAVHFEEDKFWGFLDNGARSTVLKELQNCLHNVETEDISLTCEEGDTAVGFSPSLSQFYRCIILQRLRNSFLVRYIDYGNTENITKLQHLSPMLLKKKSYVICCEKPISLTSEDLKLAFETTCLATVKTVDTMRIEMSFSYKNRPVSIYCYPWCYGTSVAPLIKFHSSVPSTNTSISVGTNHFKYSQCPRKKISLTPKQLLPKSEMEHKSIITKKSIHNKKLDANLKHKIKIIEMKDVSEIHVQLIADSIAIEKLLRDLNEYCNSEPCTEYFPIVDEVVCCKFLDNNWYRAQVNGRNKDKFKVFFIDYGNDAEVSSRSIKPLPQKFAIPKLSFCVSLYEIKNEELMGNQNLHTKLEEEIWSMELKDMKQTPAKVMFYLDGKPLTTLIKNRTKSKENRRNSEDLLQLQELPVGVSKVVYSYDQAGKIYVHQQKDLENLLSLHTKINSMAKADVSKPEIGSVYSCLSVSDGGWYRGLVKEISPKSVKVNYIDYGNDEDILINNLKELSDDLFSHPVYCVPLIPSNQKVSEIKRDSVFSVEVIGKKDGVQLVKILDLPQNTGNPTISDLKSLLLDEGFNEVKLTFYVNDVFYSHLKSQLSNIDLLCNKLENPQLKLLNQTLAKGDLVCAKSSDQKWYRASIQDIFETDSKYKVFFIDYGNCEDVSLENIKSISEDLLSFPVFCVPVKIMNIKKVANLDFDSFLPVKTVGFSKDNMQLVELLLPRKTPLPKLSSLKKQLLPTDTETNVSYCCFQDDIIFVHMASSKELLTTMEAKLLKAFEFNDLSDLPEIGDVICAKFILDGKWYRGSVEKVLRDQNSCEICFIDYGNNEKVSLENMKILPTSLCTFPVLSVPVKFTNIETLEQKLEAKVDIFPIKVIESSSTFCLVDISVPEEDIPLSSIDSEKLPESPVKVMVVHKEADVFYVQKVSNAEKLQEMLIDLQKPNFLKKLLRDPRVGELCNVKLAEGEFYRAIIKEKCNENKFKVFFVDYGNLDVVELQNIYCIPSNYSLMPGLCTAIKFKESDVNVDLNSICTVKYTSISNENVQIVNLCPTVSRIKFSSIKNSDLDTGALDVIFVFFDGEFHFLHKLSDSVKIDEMNSILEKCEDEISSIPIIDEVLVVKRQNNSRCRGCIKEVNEATKVCKVFLIDYGITEEIPLCDIFYMPEELSAFPNFCIKVVTKDSLFKGESVLSGKPYSAIVIGQTANDIPIINIFKRYMLTLLVQQKLPLNQLSNVIFYHQDGDIFFLQQVSDIPLVAEAQVEVNKHASSDPLSHNPDVGELLCAKSKADGSWYRCCIEEVISSDKWKIRFIDYGNEEIVMKENLRTFLDELAMYPSFAIPIRFIDSEDAKPTVQLEQVYCVTAESSENNVQNVKLVLQEDSHSHISSEDVCKVENSENLEAEEICLKTCGSEKSASTETCIPVNTSSEVKYFYSTSDYVDFPDEEQDIVIYSVNEECSLFCAPYNSDAIAANIGLASEITQYCENLGISSFNRESLPELDELVLTKFDDDGQWYRSVIVDNSFHPFYDVVFVDYGNAERVHIDFIRGMEKGFMSLPIQAHLCSITGFTIDEKSLSGIIDELKTFAVFVYPIPLKGFVTSIGDDKCVNIPVITKHLMEKKLITA